jgi:hypothetical protein
MHRRRRRRAGPEHEPARASKGCGRCQCIPEWLHESQSDECTRINEHYWLRVSIMVQYCSTGAAIRAQRCRLGSGEQGTSLQRETIEEALSWIQAVPAANRSFLNAPNGAGRDAAVTSSDSVPVIISLESDPTSSLLDMMTRH